MGFDQVCIYILNILMIIIGCYLFFLYIKSKEFHTYSCYNLIVMSLIITLDNIIRLLPIKDLPTFFHYLQAFLLVFFDKMILTVLSMQIIIIYIGIIFTDIYFHNEKKIFIIGFLVCIGVSAILTTLFITVSEEKIVDYNYFYCSSDWNGKRVLDTILNAILICINFFCTVVILAYYSKKKKAAEEGAIEDLGYKRQFIRFLILLFINVLMVVESYLIIYDVIVNYTDLIYLISCLIVDLGYSINYTVIKVTSYIFCKKTIDNDNVNNTLIKKGTFGDELNEDDEEDD